MRSNRWIGYTLQLSIADPADGREHLIVRQAGAAAWHVDVQPEDPVNFAYFQSP